MLKHLRPSNIDFNLDYHWILLATLNHRYTKCHFVKSFRYCWWTKYFRVGTEHWALKSIHTQTNCMPCWIIEITRWINKSYLNRLVCCVVMQCVNSQQYTRPSTISTLDVYIAFYERIHFVYSSHSYPQIVWFNFAKYYSVCYCNRLPYWYSVSHSVFCIRCIFNFHMFRVSNASRARNHRQVWFLA